MTSSELAIARLRGLSAEVADAERRLADLAAEIMAIDEGPSAQPTRAVLALLAVDLHSYFTVVESLLERVIAALEGEVARGASTHAALLRLAARSIEGVRPALVRAERFDGLDELRKFRHFFRHGYALELRHDKLRRALDPFPALHEGLTSDFEALRAFLDGLVDEIAAATS